MTSDRFAIGFISYEATLPWLSLEMSREPGDIPEIHFFVYDRVLWYDHCSGEFSDPELAVDFLEAAQDAAERRVTSVSGGRLEPSVRREMYLQKVHTVKQHIREGDIYQANLTCRFDGYSEVDPFTAYLRLRRFNPAFYSAFLNFGDYQLLSSTPERMFLWSGNRITSSPIKGTIGRGGDPRSDELHRSRLQRSPKDRAELLMIVDLVRNDLGKIAVTGSVSVDKLFRIEGYSSLFHLVSDISARVRPDVTLADVAGAILPGGSITGAPKRRAAEILGGLEETARSVYTGSIGYVGGGRADFNIAIRTMIHRQGCYRIHAGGGVVADSDPAAEYDEMLLKADNLFRAMGAGA